MAPRWAVPGVTNPNLALMTALGPCSTFSASNFINVNELTTVATVYAVAPFMLSITGPGTTSTNSAGLANAFAVVNQLVDTSHGTINGPALPTGTTLPVAEINTLADILEQCVNSAGGTASDTSTGCGKLFNCTSVGIAVPSDTITAMLNIARNPTQNVASLNTLRSGSPVFTPVLSVNAPPSDWTVAMTYAPTGVSTPTAVATDAAGNVWIANKGTSGVTKLDYTGTQTFNVTTNYSSPSAIAIDLSATPG